MISYVNNIRKMQERLVDSEAYRKRGLSYTDETNNLVKFRVKNNSFNTDNRYFLRGGIFIPTKNPHSMDNKIQKDISNLFNQFDKDFQDRFKTAREVKYRLLVTGKRNDLIKILLNENIQKIIHWMYVNNYLIHYGIVDNIYYSIADMLEPLIKTSSDENYPIKEAWLFKSAVTEIVYKNKTEFISLIQKYNLPNLQPISIEPFYNDLKRFINNHIEELTDESLIQDTLIFLKKEFDFDTAETLLSGNKENVLIDKYIETYTVWVSSFPRSYYVIDKQKVVEDEFKELHIPKRLAIFRDSQSRNKGKGLQLADCIVNILKVYIDYINSLTPEKILTINKERKNNSAMVELAMILRRSREYSPMLTMLDGTQHLYRAMNWFEEIMINK